jgi:hypothetical protein
MTRLIKDAYTPEMKIYEIWRKNMNYLISIFKALISYDDIHHVIISIKMFYCITSFLFPLFLGYKISSRGNSELEYIFEKQNLESKCNFFLFYRKIPKRTFPLLR